MDNRSPARSSVVASQVPAPQMPLSPVESLKGFGRRAFKDRMFAGCYVSIQQLERKENRIKRETEQAQKIFEARIAEERQNRQRKRIR